MIDFNPALSRIMHLDLNSCFATIEQQANPNFRGKPLAVAAYVSPRGCILAASIEAKKLGIKTGMRVKDGQKIFPHLVVLPPDPDKYRHVHHALHRLLSDYTPGLVAKSIDEFVLDFTATTHSDLFSVSREIKSRIRREIGEWISVSIGLGPSRFLAKMASNLKKPDGLEEINSHNYLDIYSRLTLLDLHGINTHLSARLNRAGIFTVTQFLAADILRLKSIFHSIAGYYWFLRLRGYEIDGVDFSRRSFGNTYSLPHPTASLAELAPILHQLVAKTSFRLRSRGYHCRCLHLGLIYSNHTYSHRHHTHPYFLFDELNLYQEFFHLLKLLPLDRPVANISITCSLLQKNRPIQLDLFNAVSRQLRLSSAMDKINRRYGSFVVSSAGTMSAGTRVPDSIGFGNIG